MSKSYTDKAKKWIKGESFFESLISDYAIPHKIIMPKDLGVDFICEWVHGEKPTGVLFLAQVKTISSKVTKNGVEARLNQLEKYKITRAPSIDEATIEYWRGFGLPAFLFVVVQQDNNLNCYYKRFTPVLTEVDEASKLPFYKVNDGTKFLAFKNVDKKVGGFARDLYIDYMRWNYYKGLITYLNPRRIGLKQYPEKEEGVIFEDLFGNYKDKICATYRKIKPLLEQKC